MHEEAGNMQQSLFEYISFRSD